MDVLWLLCVSGAVGVSYAPAVLSSSLVLKLETVYEGSPEKTLPLHSPE